MGLFLMIIMRVSCCDFNVVIGMVRADVKIDSKRVLPGVLDAPYARDDTRARKVLAEVVAEQGGGGKRNR